MASDAENRSLRPRSVTSTYETVDIDKQKYINTDATAKHVSGIYRWLDKKYEASTTAEMPLLALRTSGRPSSIARRRAIARCW